MLSAASAIAAEARTGRDVARRRRDVTELKSERSDDRARWRGRGRGPLIALALCAASAGAESWDDLKADLARQGITPSLQYQGDGAANAVGGARRGATYLGALQLQLLLDGAPLIGVPGLTLNLNGLDIHGGQASGFVGDAQGVSNIAGPPGFTPYEAWLQYNMRDQRLSLLAGLYNLSSEFDYLQSASVLLNGSFGTGPEFAFSGVGGPSIYPATAASGAPRLSADRKPALAGGRARRRAAAPAGWQLGCFREQRRAAARLGDGLFRRAEGRTRPRARSRRRSGEARCRPS